MFNADQVIALDDAVKADERAAVSALGRAVKLVTLATDAQKQFDSITANGAALKVAPEMLKTLRASVEKAERAGETATTYAAKTDKEAKRARATLTILLNGAPTVADLHGK